MYLLLNGYDISKIDYLEEVEDNKQFGLKLKKIYGVTNEFVDMRKIEREIETIQTPLICSPQTFELYTDCDKIYTYTPLVEDKPLYINDMGIISRTMVITKQCVVSSNKASSLESAENKGFMYFMEYVLTGHCKIGFWRLEYEGSNFNIYYNSLQLDNKSRKEELLYSAIEMDKTSTYKLVIYIIKKVVRTMEEFQPDNFDVQSYELEKT